MAKKNYSVNFLRRIALLSGWRRNDGNVALEFALIAVPFFSLTLATMDLGMSFWASTVLEDATYTAARKIRTGEFQTQTQNVTPETAAALFRVEVCKEMEKLLPCVRYSDNGETEVDPFYFDVRTFENFDSVEIGALEVDQTTGVAITEFDPGDESDIVLVRTYYEWETLIPGLGFLLTKGHVGDGEVLLSSTVAFRSEPFPEAEEAPANP